jgi:hypothetical protein
LIFGIALGPCTFAYTAPMLGVTFAVAGTQALSGMLLIAAKLRYFKMGRSEKPPRDIAGMLRISGARLDRGYIEHWIHRLGLDDGWRRIAFEDPEQRCWTK